MGLESKTGVLPNFQGEITAEVPTATYSGISDPNDPSVSVNSNTGNGPGPGGVGQTSTEISEGRDFAKAHAMKVFALSNQFLGESVGTGSRSPQAIIDFHMESKGSYIRKQGVYFVLQVNSNLWFRFEA